jgi:G3E family GTPase
LIPVTILCGFLGSGKTTLLRRLLRTQKNRRLGVIVNDMSELEVDGDLIFPAQRASGGKENFASLHSGSISGERMAALSEVLDRWQHQSDLDHILIETSGSTHPWPLIEQIAGRPALRLDTFATLVDAKAFIEDYGAGRALFEQLVSNEQTARRTTENLLAEQIQFASLLLLTKTDRVKTEDLPFVLKCLEILNPHATACAVTRGQIPPARVLGTSGFSMDRAILLAAKWRGGFPDDAGHALSYDIGSTVICDPRPFHPRRLWNLYRTRLGRGIHRSKGFLWLPSRDEQVLLWNQAAGGIDLELMAYWKAAVAKDPLGKLLPEEKAGLREQLENAHPVFGDRMTEITVIGTANDRERFIPELQACFCTPQEITRWQNGGTFDDPWPSTLRVLE